jgi:hypothetical protein
MHVGEERVITGGGSQARRKTAIRKNNRRDI